MPLALTPLFLKHEQKEVNMPNSFYKYPDLKVSNLPKFTSQTTKCVPDDNFQVLASQKAPGQC